MHQRRAADPAPPLLALDGVTVTFDGVPALRDVGFDLREGEIVALLGTNGAGKTTLLRVLAGLQPPDDGSVHLDGEDIAWAEPERRVALGLRYAAGPRAVFDALTVAESLDLALRARRLHGEEARVARATSLAAFPALAAREQVRGAELSGGERHMLALAQALIERPRLLAVDELSAGLAADVLTAVRDALRGLADAGTALILADQTLETAQALSARTIFLEGGEVRFAGSADALAARTDLLRPVFLPARSATI